MTDLDGVEISKAISKYETMTLGSFRSQYKMDEYPQFLTSIEVRGYVRGYVDGVAFKNAKLAKIKEALEFYANENNWMITREDNLHAAKMTIIGDTRSYGVADQPGLASKLLVIGGAKAEEALKLLEGE